MFGRGIASGRRGAICRLEQAREEGQRAAIEGQVEEEARQFEFEQ